MRYALQLLRHCYFMSLTQRHTQYLRADYLSTTTSPDIFRTYVAVGFDYDHHGILRGACTWILTTDCHFLEVRRTLRLRLSITQTGATDSPEYSRTTCGAIDRHGT